MDHFKTHAPKYGFFLASVLLMVAENQNWLTTLQVATLLAGLATVAGVTPNRIELDYPDLAKKPP